MGGMNPQIQSLLQNGLLPFLAKKMGIQFPGQGGSSQIGGPGGTPPILPGGGNPPPLVPGVPGGGPAPQQTPQQQQAQAQQPQQAGSPGGGNPSPYKIQQDPMSNVGNMQPPKPPPPVTSPQFSGGPIAGLLSLLAGWHSNKQKGEQSEAANAASALMQSIEGAKTTGDWTPVYTILHNNEKLFNKVYKGWLQKNETQQKEKQSKEKPPDPDVQGFEAGIQQYMQKKQQSGQPGPGQPPQGAPQPPGASQRPPQGPPPQGSAPTSVGGYQLPAAGPQQQLQQQTVSAERQAQRQDPGRSLSGQLSSDEQRQVELNKTGLASTPQAQAKLQAEMAKYQAEMTKSATELQIASANAQKAQAEFQKVQTEAGTAGEKGKQTIAEGQLKIDKAKIDLDIAKVRYQTAQMGGRAKGQAGKMVSMSYQTKIASAQAAMAMIQEVQKQNRGFSYNEVQKLQQELKTAGANSLATDLPSKWMNWMHGTGQVNDYADRVGEYKTALEKALAGWQSQFGESASKTGTEPEASGDGPAEGETDEDALPEEGDEVDFKGDAEHPAGKYRFNGKEYVLMKKPS